MVPAQCHAVGRVLSVATVDDRHDVVGLQTPRVRDRATHTVSVDPLAPMTGTRQHRRVEARDGRP